MASQPARVRAVSPPPAPVRVEINGIGEEEEIVEIAEALEQEVGDADGGDGEAREGPLLNRGARIVRGVDEVQGEVADRLDPEVPGPLAGPVLLDGDGWRNIDQLGAWDCAMNVFSSMEEVPFAHRVLTSILNATNNEDLDRQSLRPVGVMTPLIRTLHSHVIREGCSDNFS